MRRPPVLATQTDTGAELALVTDGEGWKEVAGIKTTPAPPSGTEVRLPIPPRTEAKLRAKSPAVLVKVAGCERRYADIVRAVKQNSELNLVKLGARVTGKLKTMDGYLLVELVKGVGSVVAAQKFSSAIATRLGDVVGAVSHLGQYAIVEIVDLNAVATESETPRLCGWQYS